MNVLWLLSIRFVYVMIRRDTRSAVTLMSGAFVAAIVFLACASFGTMLQNQDQRERDRTGVLTTKPEQAHLAILLRGESIGTTQIPVVWLEPVRSTPLLPPGLDTMLEPGEVAASPAALKLLALHPDLGARYRGPYRQISAATLRQPDELIIMTRPAADRTIRTTPSSYAKGGVERWFQSS